MQVHPATNNPADSGTTAEDQRRRALAEKGYLLAEIVATYLTATRTYPRPT